MPFPEILELSVLMFFLWATEFNMCLGTDLMDRSNSSVAILGSYKLSCFLREVENRNYVASVTGSAQLRFSPLYLKVQVLELLLGVRKHLRHSCAGSSVEREQFFGCWWVEESPYVLFQREPSCCPPCPVMVWILFWSLRSKAWLTWVEGKHGRCPWRVWCSADSVGCEVLLTVSLGKLLDFPDFQLFPFLTVTVVVINLPK